MSISTRTKDLRMRRNLKEKSLRLGSKMSLKVEDAGEDVNVAHLINFYKWGLTLVDLKAAYNTSYEGPP
jgi:hypothetical protein